ncbi:maleylpyruvate isomerase family mycothiol-dependent enzyme [Nocardia sp. NPDC005978]|uniref:maleylpyruvate isomerase family mycothiol-dependent enzyme n=1 Tax=Nocardia sp. NPDC005978 TaxID=3156725 RepID=UPI0033ACDAA5
MTSQPTPTADQIWCAVAEERAALLALLEPLPETAWDTRSLCADWRVRDVVAHLILSSEVRLPRLLRELIRARGDIHGLIRDSSIAHAEQHSATELLAQLRESVPVRFTPFGTGPIDRLMDLVVHAQDIAIPLGIDHPVPAFAGRLALEHVWGMRDFRAQRRFRGRRLMATDLDWAAGSGAVTEARAVELLMLITGRTTG